MQGRKYNPTLTSYTNFTLIEQASLISGETTTISNGSVLYSSAKIITSSGKLNNIVRSYNGETFESLLSYTVNDTINGLFSFSFNISGKLKTFFLIFCLNNLVVAYNSTLKVMPTNYTNNLQILSLSLQQRNFLCINGCQIVNGTFYFFLSQSNKTIYLTKFQFLFNLDPVKMEYAFPSITILSNLFVINNPIDGNYFCWNNNGIFIIQ